MGAAYKGGEEPRAGDTVLAEKPPRKGRVERVTKEGKILLRTRGPWDGQTRREKPVMTEVDPDEFTLLHRG